MGAPDLGWILNFRIWLGSRSGRTQTQHGSRSGLILCRIWLHPLDLGRIPTRLKAKLHHFYARKQVLL